MTQLSQSRESVLSQLQESEEAAAQLILGVSRAQGNWQPQAGKSWSIVQCLNHLFLTNRLYTRAMAEVVLKCSPNNQKPTAEIRPGWFARWFVSQLEPPVRARFKATAKITPEVAGDVGQALNQFVESHAGVRDVLNSWDKVDFNRVRFPSPFASWIQFSVGSGLLNINAHDRRHIWQAQQVKQAPGYPQD